MKACDLMIGDYLKWNGKPYRVAQVSTPTIAGDLYDGWMLENGEEDAGDAIPINATILKKNGFREKHVADEIDRQFIYEGDNEITIKVFFNYMRGDDGVNIIERMVLMEGALFEMSLYINYVHELQHALKLCGIKKEIKL